MQHTRLSNVLVISTDEQVVRTVSSALGEIQNAKVEIVETAARAKTHLGVVEYDVILADTSVPDIFTMITKLLQPEPARTPLVMIYDKVDEESAMRAVAGGAYDAVCKSSDPVFVRAAIRRALDFSSVKYKPVDRGDMPGPHPEGEDGHRVELSDVQEELASQLADVSRLHELSGRLSVGLDLTLVLNEVLSAATALMAADMAVMSFYDAAANELYPVASIGMSQEYLKVIDRVPLGQGVCGLAAKERRRVSVQDIEKEEYLLPYHEAARVAGFRAVYSVPLIARPAALIGTLTTYFQHPHEPSNRELRLLDLYLRQAVEIIDNARLHQASQDATSKAEAAERDVAFLAEAGAVLARSLDFEVTLRNVAQLVVPHLADWCLVDLIVHDGSLQRMAVAHADPTQSALADNLKTQRPMDHESRFGSTRIMRTGWPEMFDEMTDPVLALIARNEQDLEVLRQLNIQSCVCAPLQARGRNLGVMTFFTTASGRR